MIISKIDENLSPNSHKRIKIKCDYCKTVFKREYRRQLDTMRNSTVSKDSCLKCLKLKNLECFLNTINCDQQDFIIENAYKKHKLRGIYSLRDKSNNKAYIGSSKDIIGRWKSHIIDINNKSHHCKELNDLSIDNIEFLVLEITDEKDLVNKEYTYIRLFKTNQKEYGYNDYYKKKSQESLFDKELLNMTTFENKLTESDIRIIKNSLYEGVTIEEIALKHSISKGTVSDIKNARIWKDVEKHLNPLIKSIKKDTKGQNNACSKLTEREVREIKSLLENGEETMTKIAEMFNVSRTLISHIKYKRLWSHITLLSK